ncbi:MAG: potassium transporter Kup [Castellaniella sp.]|uniref:potassium transporter Kup n=1 Tax=Castellaniella sp. TaxID=1955812 RepID=UPI00121F69D6|nr:potassium transporter Kup [Castellaniella sp.]TAN29918.1 MAG: potassium transporter Kup [Castellaniella sp.]
MATQNEEAASPKAALLIGALGIVYGDIGTSPLYTIKVALAGVGGPPDVEHVLGMLSILFWMLVVVASLKYVVCILSADNRGEGGTLALMELAMRGRTEKVRWRLILLGLIGASLFYGDSMITPAISVLSAVEGIGIVSHGLDPWIVPISAAVLVALFMFQSRGTGTVGRLFGPVMLLWFLVLGTLGAWRIIEEPQVLKAVNPLWAVRFIADAPLETFLALGALVLALTGAEALYADMGHFGRSTIRRSWFSAVFPALVLCYFGQGALLLSDPSSIRNPFFLMAPDWGLVPLVALATVATVIASQSVISGAFSMTRQAVQLGYWPRMTILHTSAREEGQIYLPRVNWLLMGAVLILILAFGSSDRLAHAYGFAVTGTMLMTSVLAFAVLPRGARGGRRLAWLALITVFLVIDVLLFSSNTLKLHEGGWLPLVVGIVLLVLMTTWKRGRQQVHDTLAGDHQSLGSFMESLEAYPPVRVPGTSVFMSMIVGTVPPALLHNLKHNKVLHEQALFLTIEVADEPYVPFGERLKVDRVSRSSWQAIARWGFKQEPNVPQVVGQIAQEVPELNLEPMQTSYFLSRQTIIVVRRLPWYKSWRRHLFALMARNASRSTRFYRIPPNRVVEMGMQMEL